ncbi:unnamed protein product [Nesidiocoris tenuis]|uniref:Uncharacterized protein n=1 Tax=Nesidiocoris tenuis TaxID=355587 RepID=A0A6H5GM67_9HEMI|nr:unnamed protein product [Nesidiocoris tenuis]
MSTRKYTSTAFEKSVARRFQNFNVGQNTWMKSSLYNSQYRSPRFGRSTATFIFVRPPPPQGRPRPPDENVTFRPRQMCHGPLKRSISPKTGGSRTRTSGDEPFLSSSRTRSSSANRYVLQRRSSLLRDSNGYLFSRIFLLDLDQNFSPGGDPEGGILRRSLLHYGSSLQRPFPYLIRRPNISPDVSPQAISPTWASSGNSSAKKDERKVRSKSQWNAMITKFLSEPKTGRSWRHQDESQDLERRVFHSTHPELLRQIDDAVVRNCEVSRTIQNTNAFLMTIVKHLGTQKSKKNEFTLQNRLVGVAEALQDP